MNIEGVDLTDAQDLYLFISHAINVSAIIIEGDVKKGILKLHIALHKKISKKNKIGLKESIKHKSIPVFAQVLFDC